MNVDEILDLLKNAKGFDWNKGNIGKNWEKHKVNDKECEEIFFNQPLLVSLDEKHSAKREKRFQAFGQTNKKRKLFVAFTFRNSKIRVISARNQNQKERRKYEKT